MNLTIFITTTTAGVAFGAILGYYARQSIAKRRAGTIEQKLQKKINEAKKKRKEILKKAEQKAKKIEEETEKKQEKKRRQLSKTQQLLLKRENSLDQRKSRLDKAREALQQKVNKLRGIKKELNQLKEKAKEKLEKISGFSQKKAKQQLLENIEEENQKEILQKIKKLEKEEVKKYERKAKEILASTIQKLAVSQTQDLTTSTVLLESEDLKGRIIGKEGRNIRAFEKVTGVELVVDESPEAVVISSFNPVRRAIAKLALENLVRDGRIQPARIEDEVKEAQKEIKNKIEEAGEKAVYETGVVGLEDKITELLGKLYFRTSYGQNVLLHSMEVSLLAEALANELGADSKVAKRAGLLHDIGKAVDHQIKGSHVDIGIKILEKFGESKEIIDAMKSHHEEYPPESLEAVIVETADAISGARPGARKDTLENYLQRLEDLEEVALSFNEVEKAYAIQSGREVRVFVNPEKVDDVRAQKIARDIAKRIEKELNYPGEIKINVIRESRVIEHAR